MVDGNSRDVICVRCRRPCDNTAIRTRDKYFHHACFRCSITGCPQDLATCGFFTVGDKLFCRDDYHKLLGTKCRRCDGFLEGVAISALGFRFHPECFRCENCRAVFASGSEICYDGQQMVCERCEEAPPDAPPRPPPPKTKTAAPSKSAAAKPAVITNNAATKTGVGSNNVAAKTAIHSNNCAGKTSATSNNIIDCKPNPKPDTNIGRRRQPETEIHKPAAPARSVESRNSGKGEISLEKARKQQPCDTLNIDRNSTNSPATSLTQIDNSKQNNRTLHNGLKVENGTGTLVRSPSKPPPPDGSKPRLIKTALFDASNVEAPKPSAEAQVRATIRSSQKSRNGHYQKSDLIKNLSDEGEKQNIAKSRTENPPQIVFQKTVGAISLIQSNSGGIGGNEANNISGHDVSDDGSKNTSQESNQDAQNFQKQPASVTASTRSLGGFQRTPLSFTSSTRSLNFSKKPLAPSYSTRSLDRESVMTSSSTSFRQKGAGLNRLQQRINSRKEERKRLKLPTNIDPERLRKFLEDPNNNVYLDDSEFLQLFNVTRERYYSLPQCERQKLKDAIIFRQ